MPSTSGSSRIGQVQLTGRLITVVQEAVACSYSLDPTDLPSLSDRGATGSIRLTTSCEWTASADPWIQLSKSGGTGDASIGYAIRPNPSSVMRSGVIKVGTVQAVVTQLGMTCIPDMTPPSATIVAGGGNGSFSFTTNPLCGWTAVTQQSWIRVTSAAVGTGNGQVQFTVAPNTGRLRTGSIGVSGRGFTISQEGLDCSFRVTPTAVEVAAAAGAGKLALTASNTACEWTARSETPWLRLTQPASGAGSASVGYEFDANPTASPRTGALQVGELRVPVTQAAAELPSISGFADGASFSAKSVAPGMLVVLFGKKLGPAQLQSASADANDRFPTSVAGTRVLFDGGAAPLLYVSESQVAALAPFRLDGRTSTDIVVETAQGRSSVHTAKVEPAAPEFFAASGGQAAALNQDYSVNTPANPAQRGAAVMFFATGAGVSTGEDHDGQVMRQAGCTPRLPVKLSIGGAAATVDYAGCAPGSPAGVMQINARVPLESATGAAPVVLRIGESQSKGAVTLSVASAQ
jgi:uncharacterized protein (TIGR03437 family)